MRSGFRITLRRFSPSIYFGACVLGAWAGQNAGWDASIANWIVLGSALLATVHLLRRQLPAQNILGAIVTIAIFSGVIFVMAKLADVHPFRPLINRSFIALPEWATPLLWIIALANARSCTRLFLQRAPKEYYGFWLVGLSSLMVAVLRLSADRNARSIGIQFALALIALISTTPWFLNKRNVTQPLSYQPLFLLIVIFIW
ncbi:MAG: hypothetical protein ABIQ35_01885 [Verrucomicrobiota bacterium]